MVGGSFTHFVPPYHRPLLLLVLFFVKEVILCVVIVVESNVIEVIFVEIVGLLIGEQFPFLHFLAGIDFDMFHNLREYLFLNLLNIFMRELKDLHQLLGEISG